ncbi:MAG: hypothetical protein LBC61_05120 [Candidatus Peribacteria bacterium]|jgi:hypothetical protein|nr:hypothetical protein [Candidatus Peribacteria bacterium]
MINIIKIIIATKMFKANIIQEITSQDKLHSQEAIFLFEKSSAYSLGSELFIIYESAVTS